MNKFILKLHKTEQKNSILIYTLYRDYLQIKNHFQTNVPSHIVNTISAS
jgi:hypothetical protein